MSEIDVPITSSVQELKATTRARADINAKNIFLIFKRYSITTCVLFSTFSKATSYGRTLCNDLQRRSRPTPDMEGMATPIPLQASEPRD